MNEQNYKSNYSQNYTSQKYSSNLDTYGERSFGRNSPIYKSVKGGGGASSIKVQPLPDGVLGQPVEFESKYNEAKVGITIY